MSTERGMPYQMHRIFCATPGDLEPERQVFYDAVGDFNGVCSMPRGLLLVSLSLPGTTFDKRPYQAAVGENVRSCRYYVQLLEDTWGPPERNFERDYMLALRCLDDPAMPMQDVAVFFKKPLVPHQEDPRVREFREQRRSEGRLLEFDSPEQFRHLLEGVLSGWLATLSPVAAGA
jgi:hypothetical protein